MTRIRAMMLLALLGVACGSNDEQPGPPHGGGGSSGSGGSAGAGIDPLCEQACPVLLTCDSSADVAACEAQCNKEVNGSGYLIPEIAREYFQIFVDVQSDNCMYSKGEYAWTNWTANLKNIDGVAEPSVMKECIDAHYSCYGPTATDKSNCFMLFYRYNLDLRQQIRACFSLTCTPGQSSLLKCMSPFQLQGEPWLAGIAPYPTP